MRVGIVADLHEPFSHPNYFQFCKDTFRKYRVDKVVIIGDEVDQHALSFFEHNADGMSAGDELDAARQCLQKWYKKWPDADVCLGNHSLRHMRVAAKHGIPVKYMRDFSDVFGVPGWNYDYNHKHDGVLYTHGTGVSGKNAALNLAIQKRQSVVIGHIHAYAGVAWHCNDDSRIFGMNVGAGIDIGAYAFVYGRDFPVRPVLGCGVVIDGHDAFFVPMKISHGEEYER